MGDNSRYIDDLMGLNGGEMIEKYKTEIYDGLTLKKENAKGHTTHFLDLNITVHNGRYVLTTYDKRDDFPFKTRSFPDATGNIHITKTHNVILGQLKRFLQSNTEYSKYRARVRTLTDTLLEQGFDSKKLGEKIAGYYEENEDEIDKKYKIGKERFVQESFEKKGEEVEKKKKKNRKQRRKKEDKEGR